MELGVLWLVSSSLRFPVIGENPATPSKLRKQFAERVKMNVLVCLGR